MWPIESVWAFAPYEVTVFHCVWSKKEDAELSGTLWVYTLLKLPIVCIWTGSQLLSSDSRTSSEVLSRNHHLLRYLYLVFTSICSPTSVKRFFLTMVVVQLLSVPQTLQTPETFSLSGKGTTPSWCSWLECMHIFLGNWDKVVPHCCDLLLLWLSTGLSSDVAKVVCLAQPDWHFPILTRRLA